MNQARILVVEDERIIAKDIADTLRDLGHEVVGIASNGVDAIRMASELMPDLALMDIMLQGDMDGIEVASRIKSEFNIPVVYLTAYADDRILERAKLSGPLGYLIKPFQRSELRITIEMALYKYELDEMLMESREQFRALLETAGAIPWEIDVASGIFTYIGPQAVRTMGYGVEQWENISFWASLVMPEDRHRAISALLEVGTTKVGRDIEYRMITKDARTIWVRHIVNFVPKGEGVLRGFMFDITDRKEIEIERERLIGELQGAIARIKTLSGLVPICAWCKKIRDDKGYWSQVEEYIQKHSEAEFTHGMCPDCQKKMEVELDGLDSDD